MHVLITGGAGMLGCKLAQRLIQDRMIGEHEITKLTLSDITTPKGLPKFQGVYAEHAMDMGDPVSAKKLIQQNQISSFIWLPSFPEKLKLILKKVIAST